MILAILQNPQQHPVLLNQRLVIIHSHISTHSNYIPGVQSLGSGTLALNLSAPTSHTTIIFLLIYIQCKPPWRHTLLLAKCRDRGSKGRCNSLCLHEVVPRVKILNLRVVTQRPSFPLPDQCTWRTLYSFVLAVNPRWCVKHSATRLVLGSLIISWVQGLYTWTGTGLVLTRYIGYNYQAVDSMCTAEKGIGRCLKAEEVCYWIIILPFFFLVEFHREKVLKCCCGVVWRGEEEVSVRTAPEAPVDGEERSLAGKRIPKLADVPSLDDQLGR